MQDITEKARRIKLVVFDVDGVLTDGGLFIDNNGREHKVFHSRDGHGMKMLQQSGVELAVITGRRSESVAYRMAGLGIEHVFQGEQDKLQAFEALLERLGLSAAQTAFVGDDIVDLPVMIRVGLAVAVSDAYDIVKKHAHWQTPNRGGHGAARDVCELVMEAQGSLAIQLQKYLASD